jgi:hypothetical protein
VGKKDARRKIGDGKRQRLRERKERKKMENQKFDVKMNKISHNRHFPTQLIVNE